MQATGVFAYVGLLCSSLILASKPRQLPIIMVGYKTRSPCRMPKGRLSALFAKVRLMTITLAYKTAIVMTSVKRFIIPALNNK
jgi:hypothetical protein